MNEERWHYDGFYADQYGPCLGCAHDEAAVLIDPRGGQKAGSYHVRYHLMPAQEAAHRIGGARALMAYATQLVECRGKRHGR